MKNTFRPIVLRFEKQNSGYICSGVKSNPPHEPKLTSPYIDGNVRLEAFALDANCTIAVRREVDVQG